MAYLATPAACFFTWAISFTSLVDDTGRSHMWKNAFSFWKENADPFIGFGQNSGFALIRIIQKIHTNNINAGIFPNLHNGWLQMLFENGIFGLLGSILIFAFAMKKSDHDPVLFSTVCACAFSMAANWPLHFSLTALLIGLSLTYTLKQDDVSKTRI